ncbi:MAG TPA: hypothetical protein VF133_04780 [Terriglobales bacterium]
MRAALRLGLSLGLLFPAFAIFAADQSGSPSVSFILDFPNSNPSHYEITIFKDDTGSYSSNGQLSRDAQPAEPQTYKFTVSDQVRQQVFELAKRAHYFNGKIDSGRSNIANTGAKTLTYKDGEKAGSATYNYSPSAPVQELTSVFQNLSTTLEFGRRLTFFHKYQKLALDDELKNMEELRRNGSLGDIRTIAPVLNDIANDHSVMNVSRARAMRLLALAGK